MAGENEEEKEEVGEVVLVAGCMTVSSRALTKLLLHYESTGWRDNQNNVL